MANYSVKLNVHILAAVISAVLLESVHATFWSCSENATKLPLNVDEMSGVWYEVARAPQSDIPACVKVIAPKAAENNKYILQLDYVNNVNKGWKRTQENLTFPFNTVQQNGTFELTYSGDNATVDINFQYMGTLENVTLVCGYSGIASGVSIVRLLTRNAIVDQNIISTVDKLLSSQGIDASLITWVEQGGRCNGGYSLSSSVLVVLLAFFLTWLQQVSNTHH